MSTPIQVGDYRFAFQVLTTGNSYDAELGDPTRQGERIIFRANELSYGEGSGTVAATFEVAFSVGPRGVSWQARAEHAEPIKGIRVSVTPLPAAEVLAPVNRGFELADGDQAAFTFPFMTVPVHRRWKAQFVVLRAPRRVVCIESREYPPRVKRLWITREADRLRVDLFTEANARDRSGEYQAPPWTIRDVRSWETAVDDYGRWMEQAYGLVPFERRADVPAWLKRIALVVMMVGEGITGQIGYTFANMERRAEELAAVFPAGHTLLYLAGYDGRMDMRWPDIYPAAVLGGAAGFRGFVERAHALGFRIMPHLSVWGVDRASEAYRQLQDHLVRDSEGRVQEWEHDRDRDGVAERIFAYVSPDAPAFRRLLQERVRVLVEEFGLDAIHFDQSHSHYNDPHHDHYRGVAALYTEMKAAFPHVLFAGEGLTELTAPLFPLAQTRTGYQGVEEAEGHRRLFHRYVRRYGHPSILAPEYARNPWGFPRSWSLDLFRQQQAAQAAAGTIPTLNLPNRQMRLDSEGAQLVLQQARTDLEHLSS